MVAQERGKGSLWWNPMSFDVAAVSAVRKFRPRVAFPGVTRPLLGKRMDQIREERAAAHLHILCLCVVERNFWFSWGLRLEAADGLQIGSEEPGKGPGRRRGGERGWGQSSRWMTARRTSGAQPRASLGLFRWLHNNSWLQIKDEMFWATFKMVYYYGWWRVKWTAQFKLFTCACSFPTPKGLSGHRWRICSLR